METTNHLILKELSKIRELMIINQVSFQLLTNTLIQIHTDGDDDDVRFKTYVKSLASEQKRMEAELRDRLQLLWNPPDISDDLPGGIVPPEE